MEDFRSKSCKVEAPTSMQELRCYSATSHHDQKEKIKMKKKSKSTFGKSSSSSWRGLNDPEVQRKTRVASYKVYAVEGKMKGSFRKSFKWIKNTYTQMIHGW
ncbi:hypothetical protein ACOSP7_020059 [Xanthoceras sorbifolium]